MYRLIAIMQAGHEIIVREGLNPSDVRQSEAAIARNPRAVKRIELRDLTGSLETIWDCRWDNEETMAQLQHELSVAADHTSKACIQSAIEKL